MNKDELRIRIIPEDGQVLIETYTDGISPSWLTAAG